MEKISVTVDIPAIGGTYDFIVPAKMSVKDIQVLMVRILSSEYGVTDSISDLILFDKSDAKALRQECSFSQLGIADSAKLILM